MFIFLFRPNEKCCCAPFLPGSVPCAPCAMRTHRTASQRLLVRRACRRTNGIIPQGTPPAPRFFCYSGQAKNVAAHHFCRTPFLVLRAQSALTALRHSGRLSAAHVAAQAGYTAGDNPCTPFLCLRPDEKCCCATFLPDSVPCAPHASMLTAPRLSGILLSVRCAYLSSRSGRRSLVISSAFFARQASTSWWLPDTSTSGTESPLYTCGRV